MNAAGPFDQWPTGRGFDRWYGFQGPVADHWHPELWENTSAVVPVRKDNYHLSADLTDRAIGFVRDHVTSASERPFALVVAFGACHWPLHVPRPLIDGYRGRYDAGWEELRSYRFATQRRLKLIPEHADLAPMNPDVPRWADLNVRERAFAARTQEVYAAFLEHTDSEIARLLDFLTVVGRLDNTLLVIMSDNGASREGARIGMSDVRRNHYIARETPDELYAALEMLGSDHTFTAYPQGWAQVSNTPLKWYKSSAFGGGVRSPLLIRWPAGDVAAGGARHQFHHAVDLVPTLLDVLGLELPDAVGGHLQMPLDGVSMAYTFDAAPDAPTRKEHQHFETYGDRAIWARGWKAVARHKPGMAFEEDRWELYHLDHV